MLKTLRNAFKIEDIRRRIIYTFFMLIVVRIGAQVPVPGVKSDVFESLFGSASDAFGFFDAVTGGSLSKMSIFALSIGPYITASIIMQLLTIAIPKLEEMQREGEDGRKKIAEYTRYLTVGLSLIESGAMAFTFYKQGYINTSSIIYVLTFVVALTAGSAFLMWIGERITENGVGNGISVVLAINIISRIPTDMITLYDTFVSNKGWAKAIMSGCIIIAILVLVVVFVIFLQGGERRIPVQYAKKIQGRKTVGGQSSHIPLKVNTAGVIPIIFAQSIFQFPIIIANVTGKGYGSGISKVILNGITQNNWFNPSNMKNSWGLIVYIVLIILFAYFYTSITFNPLEVANNMKKQGGFIPGIRPGKPTSEYLNKLLGHIVLIGAVGLVIVAVIPIFFNGVFGADVSFGGTSIIIIVGVVIETLKQIESQMLVRYYKGFLSE